MRASLRASSTPSRMRHVDRDRELVAMQLAQQAALAIADLRRHLALDLDHLGALIGEDARRDRAGDHPGEIEHAHARERQLLVRHQITPSARSAAILMRSICNSSRKISPVCSPSSGGRRYARHGVPLKRYGAPG